MPIWPDSRGLRIFETMRIADGSPANVSQIDMDVHCGTHVEAPRHFLADGVALDAVPLEVFVGPALVIELLTESTIAASSLQARDIPEGTERLLLKTRNSSLWHGRDRSFRPDFVALTVDAAAWVVARGIRLVGIDYLSIQRFDDGPETHRTLFRGGVTILEGLDLTGVRPGRYTLACLPLRAVGVEAAPVRAVLLPDDERAVEW